MKHTKKIILLFATMGTLYHSSNAQNMFVRKHNATQNSYSISDIKSIKFSLGQVAVHKSNGIDYYALDTIRYINFKDLFVGIDKKNTVTDLAFSLYPNPANNLLNIIFPKNMDEKGMLTIYALDGKIVLRQSIPNGSHSLPLNIGQFTAGMYICKVQAGQLSSTQKFYKN